MLIFIILLAAISGIVGYRMLTSAGIKEIKPMERISVSLIQHSFTGFTFYIACDLGYFEEQQLELNFDLSFSNGMETLSAVNDNKADIGLSTETPFARMILKGADLKAITVTITANKHLAAIARKDRGISLPTDLAHKKIGITKGSNGEYFFNLFCLFHQIDPSSLSVVDVKPSQMVTMLSSGTVDAVITWNPQKTRLINQLEDRVVVFDTEGLYTPYFLATTSSRLITERPETIQKLVIALKKASDYINKHPQKAKKIAAKYMDVDERELLEQSAYYDFSLSLDQALILSLEDQSRWLANSNKSQKSVSTNYLDHIYPNALLHVTQEGMNLQTQ